MDQVIKDHDETVARVEPVKDCANKESENLILEVMGSVMYQRQQPVVPRSSKLHAPERIRRAVLTGDNHGGIHVNDQCVRDGAACALPS